MANKLVSVVVAVYNAEKYLNRCIESILSQTYDNIEIILVDDASTDNSLVIINKYVLENENVKSVIRNENGGHSASRNSGFNAVSGEYVIFVDADDEILPETIEEMVDCLEKSNVDCVYCGYKVIFSNGETVEHNVGVPAGVYSVKDVALGLYDKWSLANISCEGAKLYKTEVLKQKTYTEDDIRYNNDTAFSIDAFSCVKTIAVIDKNYYLYYQNAGSITYSYKVDMFKRIMVVRRKIKNFLITNDAFEQRKSSYYYDNFKLMQVALAQEIHLKKNYANYKHSFNTILEDVDTKDTLKAVKGIKLQKRDKFALFCISGNAKLLLYFVWKLFVIIKGLKNG